MTRADDGIARIFAAQQGPRPLPLFLHMLREGCAGDPALYGAALAGLRRFQEAPRTRRRMAPVRHRCGAARLRDYGGDPHGERPPVVLVPSLINPPFVLDLAPGRSLARWLAAQGWRVWLVDWGTPRARDATLDLAGHVTDRLLPMLRRLPRAPFLVGYCLGGTLAHAAAAALQGGVAGVATIASPWRFGGYDAASRAEMIAAWREAAPLCRDLGVMPMEFLQSGFWRLDPARTVRKYADFATMADADAATFVALEDWANAGAPLTHAAAAELFDGLVARDLSGRAEWRIGGTTVDPLRARWPVIEFVSTADRIVPAATAAGLAQRHELATGHVGMMVGSRAEQGLWRPLAGWLGAPM